MNIKSLVFITILSLPFIGVSQKTIIHCGNLIDGIADQTLNKRSITIENGIIVDVSEGFIGRGANDVLIDLSNATVLPGLMDMHVHLEFEQGKQTYLEKFTLNEADIAFRSQIYAERTLMAGFTTVRDLGGTGVNVSLRNAIDAGLVKGPRIFTAAKSIAITGGHADPTNGGKRDLYDYPGPEQGVADGPEACRQAVRQQVKNGADLIKITATGGVLSLARDGHKPQFTEAEIIAIVETANDFGITTAAHAHGDEGMRRAVEAGINSIEHGTMMSEATMKLMKTHGTYYVPTLTAGHAVSDSARVKGFFPELVRKKAEEIGPQIQATFAKAQANGVKIAFGTDAGVFTHGLNAKEFGYMVQGGMSPMKAIQSASIESAKLLRVEKDLGSIEIGKKADIIAVRTNPLIDIKTMESVIFVMKDGKVYKK
jgi:imidazolonepropionase-like amidohydrolase